jgi:hypothetical protein
MFSIVMGWLVLLRKASWIDASSGTTAPLLSIQLS